MTKPAEDKKPSRLVRDQDAMDIDRLTRILNKMDTQKRCVIMGLLALKYGFKMTDVSTTDPQS